MIAFAIQWDCKLADTLLHFTLRLPKTEIKGAYTEIKLKSINFEVLSKPHRYYYIYPQKWRVHFSPQFSSHNVSLLSYRLCRTAITMPTSSHYSKCIVALTLCPVHKYDAFINSSSAGRFLFATL